MNLIIIIIAIILFIFLFNPLLGFITKTMASLRFNQIEVKEAPSYYGHYYKRITTEELDKKPYEERKFYLNVDSDLSEELGKQISEGLSNFATKTRKQS